MVAVIKTGHSIHRIFNYNENKVKQGVAVCIGAGNYPIDPENMGLNMKLNRFLKQLELNKNVSRNSVHISLNFHVSESHFEKEKLLAIADNYMDKIGFGKQPFLVYQHMDAGHPHIHIISIKVRQDGSRIDMNNIGRNQSEQARKAIEKEYGLVVAEAQKKEQGYRIQPVSAAKVMYGNTETKAAIQQVLDVVLPHYLYASLPELNAILKQYNVTAERGMESSRIYDHDGLLYRVLDTNGNPVGIPIKASLFYTKPTMKWLEQKFIENERKRIPFKSRVKNVIDTTFLSGRLTIQELMNKLEKEGIYTLLRQNANGVLYGITYVDHQTKCVFNGSALGKVYSAKAIQERCVPERVSGQDLLAHPLLKPHMGLPPQAGPTAETKDFIKGLQELYVAEGAGKILEELMQSEREGEYVAGPFRRRSKKRKKGRLNQKNQ